MQNGVERMIDNKSIDYKSEYNKAINKLVKLRQKYDELEENRDYVKSLLDVEFEKRIKLQKENKQLRKENKALKDANEGLIGTIAHFELEGLE